MIPLPPRAPRKRTETDVVYECLAAVNRIPGVRATRNNVGVLEDKRGVPVTYGLGFGSPDIVGILTLGGKNTALVELAGLELVEELELAAPIALAFGIEVKKPIADGGRAATRRQRAWHHVAKSRGMPVGIGRTPNECILFVTDLRVQWAAKLRRIGEILA